MTAQPPTACSREISTCEVINRPSISGRLAIRGSRASKRIRARAAVRATTLISRLRRIRSLSSVAGSWAACVKKGIDASKPTCTALAPSTSAKATRIKAPENAPVMLAHARSSTR